MRHSGLKLVGRDTSIVAWCIAALFGLFMALPLIHATAHRAHEAEVMVADQASFPAHAPVHEEENEQCDACLALAFGRHFGADPIVRPYQISFARVLSEPAAPAIESVIVRHMLPPPSRGPPSIV